MTKIHFEAKPLSPEQLLAHDHAVICAKRFQLAEKDLLFAIMEVDRLRIYEEFGEAFLTPYCEKYLKLSGDVAAIYVRVARCAREVPALKEAMIEDRISLTKAKTIVPVLAPDNCATWINMAEQLTKRQLEREVANASPGLKKAERVRAAANDQFHLEVLLSHEQLTLLNRARQLLSEKLKRNLSYAETIGILAREYLEAHDPVRRADRVTKQKPSKRSRDRSPKLSAQVKHAVHRRDRGRCQAVLPDRKLCGSRRWIHLHHIKPRAEGGEDTVDNLTTLCSAHHRQWHDRYSAERDFNTASRSSPETGSNARSTR